MTEGCKVGGGGATRFPLECLRAPHLPPPHMRWPLPPSPDPTAHTLIFQFPFRNQGVLLDSPGSSSKFNLELQPAHFSSILPLLGDL